VKRVFDIVVSILILILFLPIGILIGLWIAIESKGGIFYSQQRVGQFGKPFHMFKFRTMRPNADQLGKLTIGMKDPRITPSGVFLRKFKLDEFPQFINVLKGDMSIVGPRPEVQEYVDLYTPQQIEILKFKPGITDYASLTYYDENRLLAESTNPQQTYVQEIMPAKIELNRKYLMRSGLLTDCKLIALTFLRMFK
jgi:lipopolysaccharide/colanic/teichoic acid biosynthesis glycosyltransferase